VNDPTAPAPGSPVPLAALAAAVPPELLVRVIAAAGTSGTADDDVSVVDVTNDSREVGPGWLFCCVRGERHDGHRFAAGAVDAGAVALLVEEPLAVDVPQIVVRDVRQAMGHVAAEVHGHPSRQLRTVGITGTNGKTTTAHLVAAILQEAGFDTRVQGTLSGARTTPEAPELQRRLAGWVAGGADAVVMEVSSHALALHRVAGMRFDAAVFTNLGRDHLDLHGSMEAYFRAKASLFRPELSAVGVTNLDDTHGRLLLDVAMIDMVGFGDADVTDVAVGATAIDFVWRGHPVHLPLGGRFNVSNALAALTCATVLGIEPQVAVRGLAGAPPVPGRFEVVSAPGADVTVVVDYAHTPDGLEEVLATARSVAPDGRVIAVFGCGGDRDADKRPLMGAVAARLADVVIITSDNPRHEEPVRIIQAAEAGVEPALRSRVRTEVDRRVAIGDAVRLARPGDIIVVAGKGHETTQTIGDDVIPFDDREVARELLAGSPPRNPPGASS
jgi:UDP-N-acetylmuramoyl-L-alanyl-D-glutamate--2,6-diaminopimelate ligase